ncbi:MAG: PQQ-binding-like beta-propeller repeat protein [Pirellulales bacterium]
MICSTNCDRLVRLAVVLAAMTTARGAAAADWPNWRGPQQDRTSLETGLADGFDPRKGVNVLWKSAELATRSTPIVMNGKLYTLTRSEVETPREGEKVICADAATGKILWQNRFNVYLSDVPDTRVGWSCCAGDPETGNVYALGVCGYFQCLDGETGKTKWSRSLHEEFGLLSTYGGRTNVPVIFEDLVIISAIVIGWGDMAKPAHRFLAFDKKSGEVVWFNGTRLLPYDTTYSTPSVATVDGQALLVFGSGDGAVWGMQPRTGKGVWKYQFSRRGLNVSPLVVGNLVFASHSEENVNDNTMGAVVAIDPLAKAAPTKTGELDLTPSGGLWRIKQTMSGKSSPIMVGNRLITVDDRATVWVLNAETGKVITKKKAGRVMRSTPFYADGKFYFCTANGYFNVYALENDKLKQVSNARLGEECHGSPIVANGRIYLPTADHMYCIADKAKKANVKAVAKKPAEKDGGKKPAHIQIVPAEVLLRPGQKQTFKVRLFNATGQPLEAAEIKTTEASFTLEGPGEITPEGVYTAASSGGHTATTVQFKASDLTGSARIRVVPDLPWKFDFENGEVPITWVGARYRHQNREIDGNRVIVKVSTIPKGTRSRAWMGHPGFSNYTIQADVRGALTDNKMPDIGMIAQRYTLDLQGEYQRLQIRTWGTVERMAKSVAFKWQPDKWYRMKFMASVEEANGKPRSVLRGKIWPKEDAEPSDWTIEATDDTPNLTGSPGLYGSAKAAELYLDNLTVTPNPE